MTSRQRPREVERPGLLAIFPRLVGRGSGSRCPKSGLNVGRSHASPWLIRLIVLQKAQVRYKLSWRGLPGHAAQRRIRTSCVESLLATLLTLLCDEHLVGEKYTYRRSISLRSLLFSWSSSAASLIERWLKLLFISNESVKWILRLGPLTNRRPFISLMWSEEGFY